jgi:spore coat protein U-like protein
MKISAIVRSLAGFAALGVLVLMPTGVLAATTTADLSVGATVTNNCTISTAALTFGTYDPVVGNSSANLDGTGRVSLACTKGATAAIALGAGSGASGSTRRLADGTGNFLTYDLYQDSGRAVVWSGSGSGLMTPVPATSKVARDFTVYGRVQSNQDVPAGTYSDMIVATVNF